MTWERLEAGYYYEDETEARIWAVNPNTFRLYPSMAEEYLTFPTRESAQAWWDENRTEPAELVPDREIVAGWAGPVQLSLCV